MVTTLTISIAALLVVVIFWSILDYLVVTLHVSPRLEVGYLMGNMEKIKQTSRKIRNLLKQIPEDLAIKFGAEFDLIPKPVVKLFIEIRILHLLTKKEKERQNGDRNEGNKRLHCDDEGVSQRDST